MLIKVNGVVRLTRDVSIKYTQSGSAIADFGVASSKKYKTQSGEQKEKITFIDCTAFSRLGEICNQYLRKGSKIYIIGELELQQWTNDQGQKRSKHSVTIESMEMLDTKQDSQNPNQPQQNQNNYGGQQGGYSQPQQSQGYGQPQAQHQYSQNQGSNRQPANVPEINIDDDE